jgi:hypothetical protein
MTFYTQLSMSVRPPDVDGVSSVTTQRDASGSHQHDATRGFEGKAISVTGRGGPYGCETSRLPHFPDNRLIDGGEVVSLTRRSLFTPPGRFLVLNFLGV